jgi:hypothetical protein
LQDEQTAINVTPLSHAKAQGEQGKERLDEQTFGDKGEDSYSLFLLALLDLTEVN